MRWQSQTPDGDDGALPGLDRAMFTRTVRTPEFAGITFHEVLCTSALNRLPEKANSPFRWTIDPMRGCSHACRYCFARDSHESLDLDAGTDFDSRIVVKTNIVAVLRRELSRRSWHREPVVLGTDTDPYQQAEGRYRLMPGIIRALTDSGTPFSILTKGALLQRDLPLLTLAAREVPVHIGISLAMLDAESHRGLEPGAPTPRSRLDLVRALTDAGFAVNVMVAPVIPYLTDGRDQLDALFHEIAAAGAVSAIVLPMHLRGSTRDWFLGWLGETHPALLRRYRQLYRTGGQVAPEYATWLRKRVDPLLAEHGLCREEPDEEPPRPEPAPQAEAQLPLFS
ncbi:Rv2578c family radical SAM protein [Nocardia paucivorans]|uniref:Rv2578c family radical SAM protein n=1 Tax=Nocardia paucivorans TaxID=114259 RepID=UPI000316EA47|nr:Rv2578c family radical SAM protein [Nocardia paucivorans]